jgi:hypothetical protein
MKPTGLPEIIADNFSQIDGIKRQNIRVSAFIGTNFIQFFSILI